MYSMVVEDMFALTGGAVNFWSVLVSVLDPLIRLGMLQPKHAQRKSANNRIIALRIRHRLLFPLVRLAILVLDVLFAAIEYLAFFQVQHRHDHFAVARLAGPPVLRTGKTIE